MSETAQPEEKVVDLYDANEGVVGRDGGPYLDIEERREAEKRRAYVEGREPDFDNLPATAGTKLVTASQLLDASTVNVASLDAGTKAEHDQELMRTVSESDASDVKVHSQVPAEAFAVPEGDQGTEPEPKEEDTPETKETSSTSGTTSSSSGTTSSGTTTSSSGSASSTTAPGSSTSS